MGDTTCEKLLKDIEILRSQLHTIVNTRESKNIEQLFDVEVLQISKQLDKLIIEYMSLK